MPQLEQLVTAFDLPPEKAKEFFRSKKIKVTEAYDDITAKMHTRAFTVAGVTAATLLTDIKNELQEALDNGESFQEWKKNVRAKLGDTGWSSEKYDKSTDANGKTTYTKVEDVPSWRWELIYRQNMQTALQAGRYLNQQATIEQRPYLQFININDNRSSKICPQYSDLVARADDAVWSAIYPPNHFRCRSRVRSMSERQAEREGVKILTEKQFEVLPMPEKGFKVNPASNWEPDLSKLDPVFKKSVETHIAEKSKQ